MREEPSDYRFEKFVANFNAELFFEAHEVLEDLWRETKGPERDFYHGLIQIAAAYVHVQRGNAYGWKELLNKAKSHLRACENNYPAGLLADLLRFCEKEGFSGDLPKIP